MKTRKKGLKKPFYEVTNLEKKFPTQSCKDRKVFFQIFSLRPLHFCAFSTKAGFSYLVLYQLLLRYQICLKINEYVHEQLFI